MTKIDFNDPQLEGIKQATRIILIAVLPVIISQLQAGTFEPRSILVALAIAVYSGLDKYDHIKKAETILTPITNILELKEIK